MAQNYLKIPTFRRTLRGYDPEQVDSFARAVQDRYYSVCADNEKLKDRLNALLNEGKKRGVEEEMRRSEIEEIRDEAERLLEDARVKADKLVADAKRDAERIRVEARDESEELLADTRAYTDEAKAEALALVKERDAALARAEEAVARLRLTVGEEYGRIVRLLDGFDADRKEDPEPVQTPREEEKADGEEPAAAASAADGEPEEGPVYTEPSIPEPDVEPIYSETVPETAYRAEPETEEEPEEPVWEEPAFPEDLEEEETYGGEEPADEEDGTVNEPSGGEPEGSDGEELFGPDGSGTGGSAEEETSFEETPRDGSYRDYDLDEILKGLSFMTSEKTDAPSSAEGALPEKDEDIVDALKKKFGEPEEGPAEETAGEDEEDGPPDPDDIDFYDEEHEDGEEFDPNDYTRLFK